MYRIFICLLWIIDTFLFFFLLPFHPAAHKKRGGLPNISILQPFEKQPVCSADFAVSLCRRHSTCTGAVGCWWRLGKRCVSGRHWMDQWHAPRAREQKYVRNCVKRHGLTIHTIQIIFCKRLLLSRYFLASIQHTVWWPCLQLAVRCCGGKSCESL